MSPVMHTPLCDKLGCRFPVVQTAMGWVADANLVAAACNAGGFGFLAAATIPSARLESEIQKVILQTDQPFGLNFHMFQPNAAEVVELAIRYKVRAVSYGRGPDRATIERFKAAGIVCMPTVGGVKHAIKAVELGADVVTIQGAEGGGHTGGVPTTILLPQVLDAVDVPVAAGGYCDGRGLASALAAGAVGIAMGTRFLMTDESPVPRTTLGRYLAVNDAASIRVSRAIDGLPQRVIENSLLLELERKNRIKGVWHAIESSVRWKVRGSLTWREWISVASEALRATKRGEISINEALRAANALQLIQKAMVDGVPEAGILPSGQVASRIDSLPSCADLVNEIIEEACECLNRMLERTSWRCEAREAVC
jgi:NAD(P)H-dependent flavin oxidoreductase YrpB (nitropropane dioxygenase family)